MSCDISILAFKEVDGGYCQVDHQRLLDGRNYAAYAFLANVRNRHNITPLSEARGKHPRWNELKISRCWWDDELDSFQHNLSWATIDELTAFDYSAIAYDDVSYREFLGEGYFDDLDGLRALGVDLIVFCFD